MLGHVLFSNIIKVLKNYGKHLVMRFIKTVVTSPITI